MKKLFYFVIVFAIGFLMSGFLSSVSFAQLGAGSGYFSEEEMDTKIPSRYGNLVAISGIYLYFQGPDGTIYILKQKTQSQLDSNVVVIKRGE